jgi:hypothetical protein
MIERVFTGAVVAAAATAYAVGAGTRHALAAARVEPPAPERPGPPRVALWGFCHLDVVRDQARGWVGTVHHGRVLGEATVRWHGSLARAELRDVAGQLALVTRREPKIS